MIKYSWLFPFLISVFFLGCSGGNTAESLDPETNTFFPVETYFQNEAERLQQEQPRITKTLSLNDKEEVLRPDTLDFSEELKVFTNSGINKVSWLDRYTADTTRADDGAIEQIRYQAQDDKLRTRLVEVTYNDGVLAEVHIRNRTENIVLDAQQELTYRPGKEVVIKQEQQIRFMKPNSLQIHLQF